MERRPELTIIAGPNGAGKSRLCPFYVSAKSFDGDKLMLDLRREHPDWPDRWVSGTVASQLEKQKAEALEQHKDFAFETNFSSDMVLHMIEDFRAAGFKISLCYFGLRNEDESVSRVMQRGREREPRHTPRADRWPRRCRRCHPLQLPRRTEEHATAPPPLRQPHFHQRQQRLRPYRSPAHQQEPDAQGGR